MKKWIYTVIVGLLALFIQPSSLFAYAVAPMTGPIQEQQMRELSFIDEQIQSLTNLKEYYSAKVVRLRNRVTRYQYKYMEENGELSRKIWKEAEEYASIAQHIDEELLKFQKQRELLAKKLSRQQ